MKVTASGDQTARLWDVVSGDLLGSFKGHQCSLKSVAFPKQEKGNPFILSAVCFMNLSSLRNVFSSSYVWLKMLQFSSINKSIHKLFYLRGGFFPRYESFYWFLGMFYVKGIFCSLSCFLHWRQGREHYAVGHEV